MPEPASPMQSAMREQRAVAAEDDHHVDIGRDQRRLVGDAAAGGRRHQRGRRRFEDGLDAARVRSQRSMSTRCGVAARRCDFATMPTRRTGGEVVRLGHEAVYGSPVTLDDPERKHLCRFDHDRMLERQDLGPQQAQRRRGAVENGHVRPLGLPDRPPAQPGRAREPPVEFERLRLRDVTLAGRDDATASVLLRRRTRDRPDR